MNEIKYIKKSWTDPKIIEEIASRYESGEFTRDLAKLYNVSIPTVLSYIRKSGRTIREDIRKYKINDDFFEVIDTEAKAYFLGWLLADGTVGDDNRIRLGICDLESVEQFKHAIESNNPIYHTKRKIGRLLYSFNNK